MINPRVLIVAASQNIDLSAGTALWMNELAQPYFAFRDFTDNIVLTSPNGMTISIAGAGKQTGLTRCRELSKQEDIALAWIATAVPIHSLKSSDFDILYIAGSDDSSSIMEQCLPLTAILEGFVSEQKPIAAIGFCSLTNPSRIAVSGRHCSIIELLSSLPAMYRMSKSLDFRLWIGTAVAIHASAMSSCLLSSRHRVSPVCLPAPAMEMVIPFGEVSTMLSVKSLKAK